MTLGPARESYGRDTSPRPASPTCSHTPQLRVQAPRQKPCARQPCAREFKGRRWGRRLLWTAHRHAAPAAEDYSTRNRRVAALAFFDVQVQAPAPWPIRRSQNRSARLVWQTHVEDAAE